MRNGWTGGQYSLFRAGLGAYLAIVFLIAVPAGAPGGIWAVAIAGALASAAFAAGFRDRAAAITLLVLGGAFGLLVPGTLGPGALLAAWVVVLHVFLPAAPYGSFDARGRNDPGNGWRMPDVVHTAHWIALALALVGLGVVVWRPDWGKEWLLLPEIVARGPRATLLAGLTLAVAPLALLPRLRQFAWLAAAAASALGVALAVDERPFLGLAALLVVAFEPAWIEPEEPASLDIVFYDGSCGLCHRTVRFVLAEDEPAERFRFAPLDSAAFRERVDPQARASLPDSIVVQRADGSLLSRSEAMLRIGRRLGGLWRALAVAASITPAPVLDLGYDAVARVRRRLFARPETACPVLPANLRRRFL